MGYKILTEVINKDDRYCYTIIQTKEGKFTGWSHCHPDDKFSIYSGTRYAERRAVAAWARHKAVLARLQLRTVQNLKKDFKNKPIPRELKLKIRDYSKEVEYWTKTAHNLEEAITLDDKQRSDILTRFSHNE